MKYVITGGAGFIGSHLTKALVKQDHDVTVIDNLQTLFIKPPWKILELLKIGAPL